MPIALEDGSVFHGTTFGSARASGGEVIFNTSSTGYQEILTDPSYYAQIVVFTSRTWATTGFTAVTKSRTAFAPRE